MLIAAFGFVPWRGCVVSIMNGSLGGTGGLADGVPRSCAQRFCAFSSVAVRYVSAVGLVSESAVAMSCHGTPTMPARNTKDGSRGGLPLVPGSYSGFGTVFVGSDW